MKRRNSNVIKVTVISLYTLVSFKLFGYNIDDMKKYCKIKNLQFYVEDDRNYEKVVEMAAEWNNEYENIFDKHLGEIDIYIYKDYQSFGEKVWSSSNPDYGQISGAAHPFENKVYLVSYYESESIDTIKHELVHLYVKPNYYRSKTYWIFEGTAEYFSNRITIKYFHYLPEKYEEIYIRTNNSADRKRNYQISGWIVKYIFENLCSGNFDLFSTMLDEFEAGENFGYNSEVEFMSAWKNYMINRSN